jgi:hypothetical protein
MPDARDDVCDGAHAAQGANMDRLDGIAPTGHDDPPGIVIHGTFGPTPRPAISAFIWGGKVEPVPSLPYGRRPAA